MPFDNAAREAGTTETVSPVRVRTDWETLGHNCIIAFAVILIILTALPGNWGAENMVVAFVHRYLFYLWANVCLGYVAVQILMVKHRRTDPLVVLEAGLKDTTRSMIPLVALILVAIVKPLLHVVFEGEWNPGVWFTEWQWAVLASALNAILIDIYLVNWIAFRIAQLMNEVNLEPGGRR